MMHQEHNRYIIDSKDDFKEWSIMHIEDYKPGVKRITMRKMNVEKGATIMIAFCKDEYLENVYREDK